MDWNIPSLHRIGAPDIDGAAMVCYQAFKDDPIMRHATAGTATPEEIIKVWTHTCRGLGDIGVIYATSSQLEGVAAWLPSNLKIGFGQAIRQISQLFKMGSAFKYASRLAAVNQVVIKCEKELVKEPHVTLALLAVTPEHQGKGYASRLIKPVLDKLDQEGMACFLDTELETNVRMYEHFGFKLLRETTVPKTNLKLWMMLRRPKTPSA
jgi:GNAT superfamily N-acetyltransferase